MLPRLKESVPLRVVFAGGARRPEGLLLSWAKRIPPAAAATRAHTIIRFIIISCCFLQ
jgi:hypothetical protein